MARTRPTPDELDAADKRPDKAVSGDSPSDRSPARPDPALQSQRISAYQSRVKAVYEQYAIDHGSTPGEKLKRETVSLAMHRIEAEDSESDPVGIEDRRKENDQLTEADDLEEGRTRLTPNYSTARARDGSAPAELDDPYSSYRPTEGERVLEHRGWDGGDLPDDPRSCSNPKTGRFDASWSTYDRAIAAARERTGGSLGPDSIKMYDYSPASGDGTGTLIGEQSPDRLRGWRVDGQDGHVNWWDWTGGKKGAGGAYGHDWFPDDPSTPGSRYIGWAPWQNSDGNTIEGN
jgi:hypothetical protein